MKIDKYTQDNDYDALTDSIVDLINCTPGCTRQAARDALNTVLGYIDELEKENK